MRANYLTSLIALLLVSFTTTTQAAARSHRAAPAKPDLLADFAALTQNRPRACTSPAAPAAQAPGWKHERTDCAWQDLLRVRHWSAVAGGPGASCVSRQAQWWAWSRPIGQPQAWHAAWTTQMVDDESGPEKRIAIIRRTANGQWNATEWRWKPSTREATRRWQEGRWKLLAASAARLAQPAGADTGPRELRLLQAAWEKNLGPRAGEISADTWRWQGGGLCMQTEPVGLGQPQQHLPYSVDDGRQEQRAAMQLQLARRYPKAQWLTPFRLIPGAPHTRAGAKFDAVWIEGADIKGQLWMPTKGDGPVVRLRIGTTLPAAPGAQPTPAAVAAAAQAIEAELTALASRWGAEHD